MSYLHVQRPSMKLGHISRFIALATAVSAFQLAQAVPGNSPSLYPDHVRSQMKFEVDPCDDFYEFACGGWSDKTPIPDDRTHVDYMDDIINNMSDRILLEIATSGTPIISDVFKSCMDTETLDNLGAKPLAETLKLIKDAKTTEELFAVAGQLRTKGVPFLTSFSVDADPHHATTNVLTLSMPSTTFPSPSYYLNPNKFDKFSPGLIEYITRLFKLAGASDVEAKAAVDAVLMVEKALVGELSPDDDFPTVMGKDDYVPLTVTEASTKYPLLVGSFFKGLDILNMTALQADSRIINGVEPYFDQAEKWVAAAKVEDLRAYLTFRYLDNSAPFMAEGFRSAVFDFYQKLLSGAKNPPARSKQCISKMTTTLPNLMGHYYVQKAAPTPDTEQAGAKLVEAIEEAMKENIKTSEWLDDETRQNALAKLAKVSNLIGHSVHVEEFDSPMKPDAYLENQQKIQNTAMLLSLNRVGKPVDKTLWSEMTASDCNAYYSPLQNQMVFPLTNFLNPYFDQKFTAAENFGAVGGVVGHELTHGFDNDGRKYDGDGNLVEWWSEATSSKFDTRAQCMKDQYSTFETLGLTGEKLGFVNGNNSIGENIADNGGVKIALDAYHAHLKAQTSRRLQQQQQKPKELTASPMPSPTTNNGTASPAPTPANSNGTVISFPPTPAPTPAPKPSSYESDNLFFVAFAQSWCKKRVDASTTKQLASDVHAPAYWRVNGVAMNSEAFAKAFQCAPKKRMNPEKKPINKCDHRAMPANLGNASECCRRGSTRRGAGDVAAGNGDLEALRRLSRQRAPTRTGSAISRAAANGHREVAHFLLNRGDRAAEGLYHAARHGHLDIVNAQQHHPTRYLIADAARGGYLDIVRFLNEHAAGDASYRAMTEFGHHDIVRFLYEERVEQAVVPWQLDVATCLWSSSFTSTSEKASAAANGHLDVVRFLHEHRTQGCSEAAMDSAAAQGHLEVLQYLHAHAAQLLQWTTRERSNACAFLHDHCHVPFSTELLNEQHVRYGHLEISL
ncbi:TPA: hypothetical protein N0F65_012407 [Lagenidium giganteum]|uniref:Uncharacterized protein n=1 Tax=Lagenidium giganteum TaxID=4803 RepID=A0AAV2YLQ7_9STRA|nr:TPA: hypothetical protein N0F65_012407 [Lagenidium giganteum]